MTKSIDGESRFPIGSNQIYRKFAYFFSIIKIGSLNPNKVENKHGPVNQLVGFVATGYKVHITL